MSTPIPMATAARTKETTTPERYGRRNPSRRRNVRMPDCSTRSIGLTLLYEVATPRGNGLRSGGRQGDASGGSTAPARADSYRQYVCYYLPTSRYVRSGGHSHRRAG